MIIDGERAFPIYRIEYKFHHPVKDPEAVKDRAPRWFEGLPEGRIWNGGSFERMFLDERHHVSIITDFEANNLAANREQYPGLDGWMVSVNPAYWETWVIRWFNHQTMDTGQSDEQVLESFRRFVNRKRRDPKYVLMGAEDRYRWQGDKGSPPPCRCEHCQAGGIIMINH